ncbi:MAG: hypothetical protein JRH20_31720 [Deltaproteobacteria bacterium]|nr:hypothetical protein [Deltaproteobacteria bacterium]
MEHARSAQRTLRGRVILTVLSVFTFANVVGESWANADLKGMGKGRTGLPWIQRVKQIRDKPGMPIFRSVPPPFEKQSVGDLKNTLTFYTCLPANSQGKRFMNPEHVVWASARGPQFSFGDTTLRIKAVVDPKTGGKYKQEAKGEWGTSGLKNVWVWLRVRNIVAVEVVGAPFVKDFNAFSVSEAYVNPYSLAPKFKEAKEHLHHITTRSAPTQAFWDDIAQVHHEMRGKSLKWYDQDGKLHFRRPK